MGILGKWPQNEDILWNENDDDQKNEDKLNNKDDLKNEDMKFWGRNEKKMLC